MKKHYLKLAFMFVFSVCVNAQEFDNISSKSVIDDANSPEIIADSIVIYEPSMDMPLDEQGVERIIEGKIIKVEKGLEPNLIIHNASSFHTPLQNGVQIKLFLKQFQDRDAYYPIAIFPAIFETIEPSPPIQTNIFVDELPLLGETARITCEITSIITVLETEAKIELPPETQVISGDLKWKGDLVAGEVVKISALALFNGESDQAISCRVKVMEDPAPYDSLGGLSFFYLSVGQQRTLLGYSPTPCEIGDSLANPSESDPPGLPSSSCFDYSGIWQDEDNYYSISRNKDILVMIDLSLLGKNGKPLTATYMGTKENYVYILAPLVSSTIDETQMSSSLEITFISNNKAVITPLCATCGKIVKIQKVFSNVETERIEFNQ